MNKYNFNVKFERGRISSNLKKLVQNDYNSTKINFTFDKEGRKLFKMLYPDGSAYIAQIDNNELIFEPGVLSQDGTYEVEIALYTANGRLTDYATTKFDVRAELIQSDEIVEIDDRVPILDGLINEVNEAMDRIENIQPGSGSGTGGTGENGATFTPSVSEDGIISWTNDKGLTNPASVNIKGLKGEPGADGKAATVTVGTVTTLEAGSNATVTNVGTETNAILNFGIPQGTPGEGGGSSEGGTTNYLLLENKPKINNVELTGNKTLDDLGIQAKGNYLTSVPSVYKTKAENDALYQTKGNYATTSDIPTKTSQLTNDSLFASESYVKNEIANAQLGDGNVEIDLSGYATKDDLLNKVDKELGKSLISNNEIERLANVTNYDDTAIKNQINSKASISDMTDYIEEHKDELKGDKGDTGERGIQGIQGVQGIQGEKGDDGYTPIKGTDYFTAEDKQQIVNETANKIFVPTKTSELTNDSGFLTSYTETDPLFKASASYKITNGDITNWNSKSNFSGNYDDLTNKPTIPTIPTNISSFNNDSGYLTSVPSEYVTEEKLEEAISNINTGGGTGNVSSATINSIVVVDELPEIEEENVLYLVKETVNTPSEDDVNLFDYENANILNGFISRSSQTASPSDTEKTLYIPIESGSTYKATKTSGSRFVMGSCPEVPTTSTTYTVLVHDYTGTELTITTDAGDNYLSIYYWGSEDTITEEEMRKTIVITKVE